MSDTAPPTPSGTPPATPPEPPQQPPTPPQPPPVPAQRHDESTGLAALADAIGALPEKLTNVIREALPQAPAPKVGDQQTKDTAKRSLSERFVRTWFGKHD